MFFCLRPTRFSALVQLPAAPSSAFVPGRNGGQAVTIQPRGKGGRRGRKELHRLLEKTGRNGEEGMQKCGEKGKEGARRAR